MYCLLTVIYGSIIQKRIDFLGLIRRDKSEWRQLIWVLKTSCSLQFNKKKTLEQPLIKRNWGLKKQGRLKINQDAYGNSELW
ncbi:unnamed protein product [Schistosoma intercalatum]|nr:unnamed protein product [Schistosoma intercalatum]